VREKDAEIAVPVLIAGAGPAGLLTSLLLSRFGIASLLVERRTGISRLPRAAGVNLRTMEILRVIGLADQVAAVATDTTGLPVWVALDTLGGEVRDAHRFQVPSGRPDAGYPSPAAHQQCAQDRLEPLLLAALHDTGMAQVRFATELVSFDQEGDRVRAQLVERSTGRRYQVSADYLVAADGAHSRIRSALGIPMHGRTLSRELAVLFEADLARLTAGHRAVLYRVRNERMEGLFRAVDDNGRCRWTLSTPCAQQRTPEWCVELIRAGTGDPTLDPRILEVQEWELRTATAERYQSGRVFLVGDAAHQTTPGGALGMNTAFQDAHNLAWKLAAVCGGWAAASLLDSYERERLPIGERYSALSLEIWNDMSRATRIVGAILGFSYETGALVPDGTPPPTTSDPIAEYAPSARPGSRAPHFWLADDLSTIDLFDRTFVLLTPDSAWVRAAETVAARRALPQRTRLVTDLRWSELYGIGPHGAVLVRPDGHVAWRTAGLRRDQAGALDQAYTQIFGKAGSTITHATTVGS
jgi:putative polyketide hydroxylase